jgi:DNA-binding transcriptional ArsR family regulator
VLRIHLTAEDLLKTRFASQPAPLLENVLAVATVQRREPVFERWRRSAAAQMPAAARPLFELIPPSATGPLFLDPITTDLAEGLELVQAVPASFVRRELRRLSARRPPGQYLRSLASTDRDTWRDLDLALRVTHHHLVEEAWPRILSAFRSELAWRSMLITDLSVQATLCTLHPSISWNGAVMQIETPAEFDYYPGGAGLMLMPSPLWTGRAMAAQQPDGSMLILYPAMTPLPLIDEAANDPLAELLGHTRAAVLSLALTQRTTTELARELGVSAATVSGHTKTLRAAGLIATARAGKAVLHSVTPLGSRLLSSTGRLRGPVPCRPAAMPADCDETPPVPAPAGPPCDETPDAEPGPACQVCGQAVAIAATGRPRSYCSRACQACAYRTRKQAVTGRRNLSNLMGHHAACVVCGEVLVSTVAGGSLIHTLAGSAFRLQAASAEAFRVSLAGCPEGGGAAGLEGRAQPSILSTRRNRTSTCAGSAAVPCRSAYSCPSGNARASRCATCTASAVLPTPPWPVMTATDGADVIGALSGEQRHKLLDLLLAAGEPGDIRRQLSTSAWVLFGTPDNRARRW